MTSYRQCSEDSMDGNSHVADGTADSSLQRFQEGVQVTECERDPLHSQDHTTDPTSRLTVPADGTVVGDNGRRWSADNGRAAGQKSPKIERIRRASMGLYNQTAGALEAGVSSVKKGISRAGQNVTDRAQVRVPRILRSKIGARAEENKHIMTSMDSEDGDHQYGKGPVVMDTGERLLTMDNGDGNYEPI